MTSICCLIVFLLWVSMIVVRVMFRRDFSAPIGRREMRATTGEWAGWFVLASAVAFFSLLFSRYFDLAVWILSIGFMVLLTFIELHVINWRIVYTDTEFTFRDSFRSTTRYTYREIVDIHMTQIQKDRYYRVPEKDRGVRVVLQMPDRNISFDSWPKDGKFLTVLLRNHKPGR